MLRAQTKHAPPSEKAFRQSHGCSTESSLQQAEVSTEVCGQDTKSLHAYGPGTNKKERQKTPLPGHTHSVTLPYPPSSGFSLTNWDFSALVFTIFFSVILPFLSPAEQFELSRRYRNDYGATTSRNDGTHHSTPRTFYLPALPHTVEICTLPTIKDFSYHLPRWQKPNTLTASKFQPLETKMRSFSKTGFYV